MENIQRDTGAQKLLVQILQLAKTMRRLGLHDDEISNERVT